MLNYSFLSKTYGVLITRINCGFDTIIKEKNENF